MVNNQNYGCTGGQLAPTTPLGMVTNSSPYRNPDSFEKLHVDIKTATDPADAGKADIIIVLVKGNATEAVVPVIRMLRSKDSIILTLQNGIGNVELTYKTA